MATWAHPDSNSPQAARAVLTTVRRSPQVVRRTVRGRPLHRFRRFANKLLIQWLWRHVLALCAPHAYVLAWAARPPISLSDPLVGRLVRVVSHPQLHGTRVWASRCDQRVLCAMRYWCL